MHKKIINYAKEEIKSGLEKLTDKHRLFFKRLYSHGNLDKPVNDIVNELPSDKLSWALTQVENSNKKLSKRRQ